VFAKLFDGLNDRLGYRALWAQFSSESIPGGARMAYVFGAAILGLLLIQGTTGIVLALHYAPSATSAWESVFYIETKVVAGSLIRAVHHHGASFIVIMVILHMLQVIYYQAYQKPREVTWLLGLVLMLLLLAFALTGYLLPWDERGYGATQVATGLVSLTPGLGESLRQILLGGKGYGHHTLTRFYAIHIVILPLCLLSVLALHLWSRSRHGLASRSSRGQDSEPAVAGRYWPDQVFRSFLFTCAVFALLIAYSASHPAPLMAPADPATSFPARPEWYFLPLFQLLKTDLFSGSRELLGSHALPTLLFIALMSLPFFDKQGQAQWRRKFVLGAVALTLLCAFGLAMAAHSDDRSDEQFNNETILGEHRARVARRLAAKGIPGAGAAAMMRRSAFAGEQIYRQRCAECHDGDERKAPDLKGYLSVEWVASLIKDPNHDRFFGRTKLGQEKLMEATSLKEKSRQAIAHFLLGSGSEQARSKGKSLFDKKGCGDCHGLEPDLLGDGPNLQGYGTDKWLEMTIGRPGGLLRYCESSEMPAFEDELSKDEMTAIIAWVKTLRRP
jgi:ubiquinol-cytochrome c reductase cytochrome b subunit